MRSGVRTIKIGEVSVDAGLLWVGDPCYIWEEDASAKQAIGTSWSAFCDALGNEYPTRKSFDGLGVAVSTGYGDGTYPVYAETDGKRIFSVTVKFEEDDGEDVE